MNVSIFGLGYVGCVGAACLAKFGHHIIGVERVQNKIDLINQGRPTIIENDIDGLVREAHKKCLLKATSDYKNAVKDTDISFICVGTPSTKEGHLNLEYIFDVGLVPGKDQQFGN